jgi:hypothetical protein
MKKIDVSVPGAREKFEEWIASRGGIQVWNNINLSNPGAGETFTPVLNPQGQTSCKPSWSVRAGEIITDLSRFRFVKSWTEVKRFRIGIRMGRQGLLIKVTDGGIRRIDAALNKYPESRYVFDYETQEAVIQVPVWED